MNIFVLCTGRCGSTTFIRAAEHITNFSAGHETRTFLTGPERFYYPPRHIEADNRLSWLLGRLEAHHGDNARYVHLTRDTLATAASFEKRFDSGIMNAYYTQILMSAPKRNLSRDRLAFCIDYCETVNANVAFFLRSKTHVLRFSLERAVSDWRQFWNWIGAEGDFNASVGEWQTKHNHS